MKQVALDIKVHPLASFDNFIDGPNAQLIHELKAWVNALKTETFPNCFYLWGERGSGKSHLLQASAELATQLGLVVKHFDPNAPAEPFQPNCKIMVMDDVQEYDEQAQANCFNWFVNASLPTDGIQRGILVSATLPPTDLMIREDLRTRFASGLVSAIDVLDESQRKAVLIQQACLRGLELRADVLDFMMSRFSRDLTNLVGWLDQLDAFALQSKRPITIPLIKDMLKDI
jgi:DnaA-homolog protein